jgi:hypothetical protein
MPKSRLLFHRVPGLMLSLSLVLLSVLLVACGGSGGSSGSGKKTATATPSPRPARATTTPAATAMAGFSIYRSSNFTLQYPSSWQVTAAPNGVIFSDAPDNFRVSVLTTPNPEGLTSPRSALQVNLEVFAKSGLYKNFKQINVPATTVVGGVTWQQMAATGDMSAGSQTTTIKMVLLATNHPDSSPQTQLFNIDIQGPLSSYDAIYSSAIGPMLQSFRFLS